MQIKKLSRLREKVKSIKLERRKTATILMIVLTVLLFIAALWGLFSVQHIKKVVIKGESPYTQEEIMKAASVEYGEYLFSKDPDEMETKILEKLHYIREVKVTRLWFSKLVIKVECDTPHYYMKIKENANDCYLLSKDLRVLDYKTSAEALNGSGLVFLELPYFDLETCVLGKYVEYGADEKNGYVADALEYFYSEDFVTTFNIDVSSITGIGLKSRFEGAYIDFYGKCRIKFGKPEDLEIKMGKAYDALSRMNEKDNGGCMIIDVSDPTGDASSRPVESLD